MFHIICHILFFWVILFTPIRTPIVSIRDEDKTPETIAKECAKEKYFNLLSVELNKQFGLEIKPSGWPTQDPEIYFIDFTTYYLNSMPSIEEARKLIVDVVSYVLCYINNNSEIAPYLSEHPMTTKNMFISITFVENLQRTDGWVGVNLGRGKVNFTYVYDKIKVSPETFEEAKAKVEASRMQS